ncbi:MULTISPECIES: flagellar export chaperone FliS [unclassified Arthrobacter]|uniref:flagellar export chaperone FliS n=1 Tax=unclassified Arthrobacter TaxID=235627 RepID=UPI0024E03F86|nr:MULTISPECIES: flagellar export chaperone FliS [unclassified Arthrobacter]MCC9146681.1 flagellar export chaperone FliS [Arthrobacter sp. zg-Y919]MDK1277911.1 flagellar export chaperone FliS [Arthrobacter sp. zg.Y919]WIB03495.1 flagellar export chaperone FliS [Arthrobacter sp. zg-Y919]
MNTSMAAKRAEYARNAVLSASPARLLTMLYDRLLLDLARAETAQQNEEWPLASENLLHAQAIITELLGTLKTDVWEGGENLHAIYTYSLSTLLNANIGRDAKLTRECIDLLEPIRLAWHEASAQLPAAGAAPAAAGSAGGVLGVG